MKKKPEIRTQPEQKPYFLRFLEKQELEKAAAGRTLKYPSDSDEEWP